MHNIAKYMYEKVQLKQMNKIIQPPVVLRQASIGASHVGATLAVALLQRAIGSLTVQ